MIDFYRMGFYGGTAGATCSGWAVLRPPSLSHVRSSGFANAVAQFGDLPSQDGPAVCISGSLQRDDLLAGKVSSSLWSRIIVQASVVHADLTGGLNNGLGGTRCTTTALQRCVHGSEGPRQL